MKLYATTKATKLVNGKWVEVKKGQGSNDQINIDININSEVTRYKVFINAREDESVDIAITDQTKPFPKNTIYRETIKGNQQKGEISRKDFEAIKAKAKLDALKAGLGE